ncbi:MAG: RibD family protein [Rubrivivax sp.]|nr:RibD family protein [Rubrivivax sp.]
MSNGPQAGWPGLWAAALQIVALRRAGQVGGAWARPLHGLDESGGELFALYEPLVCRAPQSPPWVIAHLGQSLDGFIATHNGDSRFVTGSQDLDHMHRLRALCDAVIVGAGTAAIDDPLLTTRRVPGTNPTRVVLDPMQRVPLAARVLQDRAAPTLWLCDERCHDPAVAARVAARVLAVPGLTAADGVFDAQVVRRVLVAQGLRVLFVEGGGVTVSRFLAQGLLDRLHVALAPVLIGEGRRGVRLPASSTMADCLRPGGRIVRLGDDVLWDFDLSASPGRSEGTGRAVDVRRTM